MNFLNALEQLLGGAAHNVANNVGHTAQAVGDAINLGVPAAAHALGVKGGPQMLIDPMYLGHPADNSGQGNQILRDPARPIPGLQRLLQQQQQIQQSMRPQMPLNGAMAHGAEDDAMVYTPGGRMPLWNVNPGTPWNNQPMYNPSMGGPARQTNPYMQSSSHSPIPSFMGNRYAQSNAGPEFTGQNAVDPMIFGYPPDNSGR